MLAMRSFTMLKFHVAFVWFSSAYESASVQLNAFVGKFELNGKVCESDQSLFRTVFEADIVVCAARCENHAGCRSVFYHSDEHWCVGCADIYENDAGLLDAAGTRYFVEPRKSFMGHNYKFTSFRLLFNESKVYCESLGGYILQVESEEENQFIAANFANDSVIWLGLTDEGHEKVWTWVHHNSTTGYTNWKRNSEPETASERPLENCAAMIGVAGFKWGDRYCHGRRQVVCKYL